MPETNTQAQQPPKKDQESYAPTEEISFADRVAMNLDQPLGVGTFVLKNVVQGAVTALCTVAAFKAADWLADRKAEKALLVNDKNTLRVAGE